MRSRRRTFAAVGAAVAVLLAAGCSTGSAGAGGTQSPAPAPASETTQSSPAPSSVPTPSVEAPERGGADFSSSSSAITVRQVRQMSVVIEAPEGTIYTDPIGDAARYADHPTPDVILLSHEHADNFDVATLDDLVGPHTQLVAPPAVIDRLPADLRAGAVSLANGQRSEVRGVAVEAVPAYGTSGEAERWHPAGRGNGYVLTLDDRRVYVAGSTEATPEMLALDEIYLALLPLYPPYALAPEAAAVAVSTFRPEFTYVYQYDSEASRDDFVQRMTSGAGVSAVTAPDIDS